MRYIVHLCYGQNHGKSLKNTVHFHGISDLAVVGGHLIFVLKAFSLKISTNYLVGNDQEHELQ